MAVKEICKSSSPSPMKTYHRYLKPGALAKLRDSKITSRNAYSRRRIYNMCFSQLSSPTTPTSPTQNEENMIPCFAPHISLINRPRCIARKKLFAVAPVFTPHTDTYPF